MRKRFVLCGRATPEEFCHIIVDTGIFEHHLPDSVLGAVERLYQHQISGREKLPDVAVNVDTPRKGRRAKTVGATPAGQRS